MRRFAIPHWVPVTLTYLIIFILSSIPGNKLPKPVTEIPDLIPHFLIYVPIGFFLHRWLAPSRIFSLIIAIGVILALLDETHQLFVPLRFFSLSDLTADIAGELFGFFISNKIKSTRGSSNCISQSGSGETGNST